MIKSGHIDSFARENLPPEDQWPELLLAPDYIYPDRLNASVELLDKTVEKVGPDKLAFIGADRARRRRVVGGRELRSASNADE